MKEKLASEPKKSRLWLSDSKQWPMDKCPLKRVHPSNGGSQLGYMLAWEPNKVYLGNIFVDIAYKDLTMLSYEILDQLLEDGWRVD